ncbi:MAG: argininosuccinate synthase [Limnochordaceae bacterium]|nr:argininosuccinate synthase [Limnochordaceae bacterium]
MAGQVHKVVLAYSGGLDTSVMIPWLRETYGCDVVAMIADVGQGEDLQAIAEKARRSGASKAVVEDVREAFAREYAFQVLRAGAVYEGRYLLGTSFARPLIAACQVKVAREEGADALAHGCTGKGNDQVRFELAYRALAPDLKVIAPWREWDLRSREDEMAYARARGIPVPVTAEKPYSVDRNLWHISYEGGILEDPDRAPDPSMFQWTVDPSRAPDVPEEVTIAFEAGYPVQLDGRRMAAHQLLDALNAVAARHGVGRVDIVENRVVGMKSRGVYETPGGTLLHVAHRELESLTLDRETLHFKEMVAVRYAELVYYGQWYSGLKRALDAFVEETQRHVTGTVKLRLYKGNVQVTGRRSPYSLYDHALATFGADGVYRQKDAEGFIALFGLPQLVQSRLEARLHEGVAAAR